VCVCVCVCVRVVRVEELLQRDIVSD